MRLKFLLVLPIALCLSSCAAAPYLIPLATYVASVNNLGTQYLKFRDDKLTSCPVAQSPLIDPATIITITPNTLTVNPISSSKQ